MMRMNTLNTYTDNEAPRLRGAVQIRLAAPTDLAAVNDMANESFRVLSAGHYTARQIESAIRHMGAIDAHLIADGGYYVAEVGRQLVACGGWSQRAAFHGARLREIAGVTTRWLDPATDAARVRAIYVHPEWAGRGIARCLMEVVEAAAQQAGFTRLELFATLTGVPLYVKRGFVSIAGVELRLPDGTTLPVVHMAKTLPASVRDAA